MKTRQGFVSNSSTSSFVILGYKIDEDEVCRAIKKQFPEEEISQWIDDLNGAEDTEYTSIDDAIKDNFDYLYYECMFEKGDVVTVREHDGYYLGIKMTADEYETSEMVVGDEVDKLKEKYFDIVEDKKLFLICGIESC